MNTHHRSSTLARLVLAAGLLWSCLLQAEPALQGFEAEYILKRGALTIGETRNSLSAAGEGRYLFQSQTVPTGLAAMLVKDTVAEQSLWRYHDGLPQPLEYQYSRTGGKKERQVQLLFDWEQHRVTNVINSDPWHMDIDPGTQDKLLYQIMIMEGLKQGQTYFRFMVADGGKTKTYEIGVEGEEVISTPSGEHATIKITRLNSDKVINIWFARDLNFLPVRIEYTGKDGSSFRAQLKTAQFSPLTADAATPPSTD